MHVERCVKHQFRPCSRATDSAVQLDQTGPKEKEYEAEVEHELHMMLTPAPPGQKVNGTDPSVHTWTVDTRVGKGANMTLCRLMRSGARVKQPSMKVETL